MKVGIITRGKYGYRVIDTIKKWTDISVVSIGLPEPELSDFIEEPEKIVEQIDRSVFDVDLLMSYALHPDLNPEIAKLSGKLGVKAIIIPGGARKAGSIEELDKISKEYGIEIEVTEICCSHASSGDVTINEFYSKLGRPEYIIKTKNAKVSNVEVVRGAPCGSSFWVAEQLVGVDLKEAPTKGGWFTQIYPCRASRGIKGKIHTSAEIHKKAVEDAFGSDK